MHYGKIKKSLAGVITVVMAAGAFLAVFTQIAEAASLKATLHMNGVCAECSKTRGDGKNDWVTMRADDGRGGGGYYWVSYTDPLTGKKEKTDAYCLQPAEKTPPREGYTSKRIDPSSGEKRWQRVAKILYFADGAPGQKELNEYLKSHKSSYPDFQTAHERYLLTHYMLSYAFDPDTAFRSGWSSSINYSSGKGYGYLSKGYQKKIRSAYDWCMKNTNEGVSDPDFQIRPQTATADYHMSEGKYISDVQHVDGADKKQHFKYTVPTMSTMYVTHKGKKTAYASGKTVRLYVGDSFYFSFDQKRTKGIVKTTVQGEENQVMPYEITVKNRQNIGFFAASKSDTSSFAVKLNIAASGQLKVQKVKRMLNGKKTAERGVRFRVWSSSFASYESAVKASGAVSYADELTTDTEGAAISKRLATGTYQVQQITSEKGYAKMSPNPVQAVITKNSVTLVKKAPIEDPEMGIRLRIYKVEPKSAGSNETRPITGSAVFGIYSTQQCRAEDLVQNVITGGTNGSGLSAPLPEGTYYVREISAPDGGYKLSREIDKIILKYDDRILSAQNEYIAQYTKANYKSEFHDIEVTKSVKGGSAAKVFLFDVVLKGITEDDDVSVQVRSASGSSEDIPMIIREGEASLAGIGVCAGDTILIRHMPVESEYEISEHAADGYRPSFTVTTNAVVKTNYDSGKTGEPLSVSEKIMSSGNSEPIRYNWSNSMETEHSLQINKKSIGTDKNDADIFSFIISFSNLNGRKPGFKIFDSETKKTLGSKAPEATTQPEEAFNISLSAGQSVLFSGIRPGSKYLITEQESDYIPSFGVRQAAGNIPRTEDTGEANEPLSTGVNAMPGSDAPVHVEFDFINEAVPQAAFNSLTVSKTVPSDNGESFSFRADFTGLDPNAAYSALREGDKTYTLQADRNSIRITEGNAGIGGVPVTILRDDGKKKILVTDMSGTISLTSLQKWLAGPEAGGQTKPYTLSWSGGEVPVGTQTVTSTAAGLSISSFVADASGKAAFEFELKSGQQIRFDNMKEGAGYRLTEKANRYEPSYHIIRTNESGTRRLDAGSGGARADLETDMQIIPRGNATTDRVEFTNSQTTKSLRLTKHVNDQSKRSFPFAIRLNGLSGNLYYAVRNGTAEAKIKSDLSGDLIVTVSGSTYFDSCGDLSGIPVKLIRSDGAERTMTTNSQGMIPASAYCSWLMQETSNKEYTVEFLGHTYKANWSAD